jgi:hypothetical protein
MSGRYLVDRAPRYSAPLHRSLAGEVFEVRKPGSLLPLLFALAILAVVLLVAGMGR